MIWKMNYCAKQFFYSLHTIFKATLYVLTIFIVYNLNTYVLQTYIKRHNHICHFNTVNKRGLNSHWVYSYTQKATSTTALYTVLKDYDDSNIVSNDMFFSGVAQALIWDPAKLSTVNKR